MFKSRLFRILVCVVLICSFIFNVVSIPSKALVIADDIALGITALLLLAACGMVIVPQLSPDISNVGQSFRTSMLDWGKSTDTYDDVVVWINAFSLYDPSGGDDDDGDDSPNKTKINLARGILAGITAWIASTIMAGKIEVEEEIPVPEGWISLGGVSYPPIPSFVNTELCPYITVGLNSDNNRLYMILSEAPGIYDAKKEMIVWDRNLNYYPLWLNDTGISWTASDSNPYYGMSWFLDNISYSGHVSDISDTSKETTTYIPYYVGDLPQKIQNGEADEDDIILSPEIDYSKLIQNGKPLTQAVTDTMSQLADGTLTYEDYLSKIESVTETVPDSGTCTDTWTPPENPGQFALDLSNYFPFCIPFDLYDFFSCLNADPVAPVIHWEIALPGGSTYPIELDLSPFDSVAQLLRRLQLLLFIVGLAIKTRDIIKG